MTELNIKQLQDCIARYATTIPGLSEISNQLQHLPLSAAADSLDTLIALYDQAYPLLEKTLWSSLLYNGLDNDLDNGVDDGVDFHALLDCYQSLFREQSALVQQSGVNSSYHFILSIPVADRPPHLQACLESIYQVCKRFGYGGKPSGQNNKIKYECIKIVVAEDSRDEDNIRRHIELVDEYRHKGLQVFHFGQQEQVELLHSIPAHEREQLGNILTRQPKERFYLKGQAANRNLSYLKCVQLTEDKHKTLYYLVDSDESLCVNRQTETGDEAVTALNYFYYADRIFRNTDTLMLTGKMVGDPPVSPAVMAANFLDDVTAFFSRLAKLPAEQNCQFHGLPKQGAPAQQSGAAYHDMAGLFGYKNKHVTYPYTCRIDTDHDHTACLKELARRLNAFFFGEHLTRKTYFSYGSGFIDLSPARTLYPGNYIVNYEGLKYIIPFGHLRLRMSGPTAGRLISAEIQARFASFNMPNLHRRTTKAGLNDDFRPGVELEGKNQQQRIDLSNEFERQFFGDLMLFTTETLVKKENINKPFAADTIVSIIEQKENELLQLYQLKHDAILKKSRTLEQLVFRSDHWWLHSTELANALQQINSFIDNINLNFGEQSLAWQQIHSEAHRAQRKQQIIEALIHYRTERDVWERLFP